MSQDKSNDKIQHTASMVGPGVWRFPEWDDQLKIISDVELSYQSTLRPLEYVANYTKNLAKLRAAEGLAKALEQAFMYTPAHRGDCGRQIQHEEGDIFESYTGCNCFINDMQEALTAWNAAQ